MINLIDFYDSFTFNIVSELNHLGTKCNVIPFDKIKNSTKGPFILGPGPGHVDDYADFVEFFKLNFFKKEKIVGICLGHQILHSIEGYKIVKSNNIIHGESVKLSLNKFWQNKVLKTKSNYIDVQRYNSLTVQISDVKENLLFDENKELMGNFNQNFLSYQFHPESIGTSCRNLFTRSIVEYLL